MDGRTNGLDWTVGVARHYGAIIIWVVGNWTVPLPYRWNFTPVLQLGKRCASSSNGICIVLKVE